MNANPKKGVIQVTTVSSWIKFLKLVFFTPRLLLFGIECYTIAARFTSVCLSLQLFLIAILNGYSEDFRAKYNLFRVENCLLSAFSCQSLLGQLWHLSILTIKQKTFNMILLRIFKIFYNVIFYFLFIKLLI